MECPSTPRLPFLTARAGVVVGPSLPAPYIAMVTRGVAARRTFNLVLETFFEQSNEF
jgi:hypothetical protein